VAYDARGVSKKFRQRDFHTIDGSPSIGEVSNPYSFYERTINHLKRKFEPKPQDTLDTLFDQFEGARRPGLRNLTINTEMLPDSLMIDVELSPEFRDGGGNHLKIEEGKSKRFCFSLDALGKTEIVERIEIDVDRPDDELAIIDCPDEETPEEIDGVLCAHLVQVYLKY